MHALKSRRMLLQEAMRLQPVAAMPLQRVAVQNFKLSNGMVVPAGVTIDLAQYTVMQDKTWGWKDGASFIPVSSSPFHLQDRSQALHAVSRKAHKLSIWFWRSLGWRVPRKCFAGAWHMCLVKEGYQRTATGVHTHACAGVGEMGGA